MNQGNIANHVTSETASRKKGFLAFLGSHPVGFWFIFWGEFAERCSYYGMRAILSVYMAEKLGLGQANAATYMSFFIAGCYFLPLVGGYLADNFFGKYRIIVTFSVPYILGHVVLGVESPWFLFLALVLLAMGSGVIKPNISTLMGLTYDQQRPGQEQLRSTAFAMFYMAINIGAAISQFMIPWIRTTYDSYALAFLFPAILMAVAFVIFAAGKKFYAQEVIERRRRTPEEFVLQWQILGRLGGLFLLVMFFWAIFDQSASTWIFFAYTYMDCTVFGLKVDPEQIQALNPVLIVLLLPGITYLWAVLDQRGLKVRPTDKMIVGFLLTGLCMGVMAYAGFMAGPVEKTITLKEIPKGDNPRQDRERQAFADYLVDHLAPKLSTQDAQKLEEKLTELGLLAYCQEAIYRRQAQPAVVASMAGLLGSPTPCSPVLAFSASLPPRSLKDHVRPENQVTVWWQMLAYLLLTVAEVLISVTGLELAFVAAPKTMKSFVTSLWLLTVGMANLFINAPVTRLYTAMAPGYYFLLLTVTLLAVTLAFVFVAKRFNRLAESAASHEITGD